MKRFVFALVTLTALLSGAFWQPASAAPAQVDLSLDDAGGWSLAHGLDSNEPLTVNNLGPTQAKDGVLTFTFPAGLSLGTFGVETQTPERLACTTSGNVSTCPLHHLDTFDGAFMNVDVAAASSLAIGAKPVITVEIQPTGGPVDVRPSDNTLAIPVHILGQAHLHYTLSIPSPALTVDQPVLGTATITNQGPDPAVGVSVSVGVLSVSGGVRVAYANGDPIPASQKFFAQFNLGTLAPGRTVHRSIQITGLVVGARNSLFLVNGGSQVTVDPKPECDTPNACLGHASIPLTIVKAATSGGGTGGGTGSGSGGSSGGGTLADTGTSVLPTTLIGLGLLALGLLFLHAGRRRLA